MKSFLLGLVLLSGNVLANPCGSDIRKFCPGVKPGQGALTKCLYQNKDQLSKACSKEMLSSTSGTSSRNPCHEDLVEFCGDMPLKGERLTYCLLKNQNKLREACSTDFKKKKVKFVEANPCAPEVVEHCYSEVKGSRLQLNRCLVKNRPKSSPVCQKKLDELVKRMKEKNSCYDDIEKFCSASNHPAETQACLEQKKASLAPKCQAAVDKQAAKIKSNPCYQDALKFCKTAIGHANKMKCLNTYKNKLSQGCQSQLNEASTKLKQLVEACDGDRVAHCSYVPRNSGKVIRCLELNKDKLTPKCRGLL